MQVRDLLSRDAGARLELRESPERGVHVKGLKEFVVKSAAEMASVLEVGGHGCWAAARTQQRRRPCRPAACAVHGTEWLPCWRLSSLEALHQASILDT